MGIDNALIGFHSLRVTAIWLVRGGRSLAFGAFDTLAWERTRERTWDKLDLE
jgi:hypothetical protein